MALLAAVPQFLPSSGQGRVAMPRRLADANELERGQRIRLHISKSLGCDAGINETDPSKTLSDHRHESQNLVRLAVKDPGQRLEPRQHIAPAGAEKGLIGLNPGDDIGNGRRWINTPWAGAILVGCGHRESSFMVTGDQPPGLVVYLCGRRWQFQY